MNSLSTYTDTAVASSKDDTGVPNEVTESFDFAPWMPIHGVWTWQESFGSAQICSIVVVLPSGVPNSKEGCSVKVNEACDGLLVTCKWPNQLTQCTELHK